MFDHAGLKLESKTGPVEERAWHKFVGALQTVSSLIAKIKGASY
jgi:hypothetical protein